MRIDKIFIINLDNRADKLTEIKQYLPFQYHNSMRFSAIDGTKINANDPEILELFSHNKFSWHAGTLGCSLSHYRIWQQICQNQTWENCLVLEDDVFFSVNNDEFTEIINAIPTDYDLCYFGSNCSEIESVNINHHIALPYKYSFGTPGYFISRGCAQKLVKLYQSKANTGPVDFFLNSLTLTKYFIRRSIMYSPADYKTDIQQNRNQVILPNIYVMAKYARQRQISTVDTLPSHGLPANIYYQIIQSINRPNQQYQCDILIVQINTNDTQSANLDKLTVRPEGIRDLTNNYILYQSGINKMHDGLPMNAILITTPLTAFKNNSTQDNNNSNYYYCKLSGDLFTQIATLAKLYFNSQNDSHQFKIQYDSANEFLDRYFYHLGSYMNFEQCELNLKLLPLTNTDNYSEFKNWLVQPKYLRRAVEKIQMLTVGRNKCYVAVDASSVNNEYINYATAMTKGYEFSLIVFTNSQEQQIELNSAFETVYIEDPFVRMLTIAGFAAKILSDSPLGYWAGLFSESTHIIYAPEQYRGLGPDHWNYLSNQQPIDQTDEPLWEINNN